MVKQVKLTRKRQLWTDSREKNNNVTLKGTELNHCISSEHRYAKKLERLTQLMYEDVKRQINRFFNSEVSREHIAQTHPTPVSYTHLTLPTKRIV